MPAPCRLKWQVTNLPSNRIKTDRFFKQAVFQTIKGR